ncbi:hypothetical protein [Vibrio sinaloensis]|uniref:hypothetical protein n=1 Tax=Vibrio TaxID=662 RepID=UPI0022AF2BC1|nr:hypothetical protein [Vibrio sinaloensis]MCZ4295600.1 hypothetical protein [Vibrio sinaloensis]
MSQTQPRYAFVCPKLEIITVQHQGQTVKLESHCQSEITDLAALAIDAATKRNIRVLLLDRHNGNQLDFYHFLMA